MFLPQNNTHDKDASIIWTQISKLSRGCLSQITIFHQKWRTDCVLLVYQPREIKHIVPRRMLVLVFLDFSSLSTSSKSRCLILRHGSFGKSDIINHIILRSFCKQRYVGSDQILQLHSENSATWFKILLSATSRNNKCSRTVNCRKFYAIKQF